MRGRVQIPVWRAPLGAGNHVIEISLDEAGAVWVMPHSGARGVGARFGGDFIERAKQEMRRWFINLPDEDLACFPEGSEGFGDDFRAVSWAQKYARANREDASRRRQSRNVMATFWDFPRRRRSLTLLR